MFTRMLFNQTGHNRSYIDRYHNWGVLGPRHTYEVYFVFKIKGLTEKLFHIICA